MLKAVKLALGITTDAYDLELQGLIDACTADLRITGIDSSKSDDPLIMRAHIFYAQANFQKDDVASERYGKAYDALKVVLSLASEYKGVSADG